MGFCAYTNKSSRWTLWGAWLAAHIQIRDFSPADVSDILQQTAQIYLSTTSKIDCAVPVKNSFFTPVETYIFDE